MQIFPRWTNKIPLAVTAGVPIAMVGLIAGMWYYFSPKFTDVGYSPKQPVPYSHKLHAGQLGIDCLYCHGSAEKGPHANLPATQTCMNCHKVVKTESAALEPVIGMNVVGVHVICGLQNRRSLEQTRTRRAALAVGRVDAGNAQDYQAANFTIALKSASAFTLSLLFILSAAKEMGGNAS